jgi:hypothetical protein
MKVEEKEVYSETSLNLLLSQTAYIEVPKWNFLKKSPEPQKPCNAMISRI